MVEVTPAMKRMAKERADDVKANKKDLKAQYELERDEKLKTLGLVDCDMFFKDKMAEVRKIAGKTAEDDMEEEMMIVVEEVVEDAIFENMKKGQMNQGENQGTT
jgi:UTP-glucose-1-phosphate uridylyltransferase